MATNPLDLLFGANAPMMLTPQARLAWLAAHQGQPGVPPVNAASIFAPPGGGPAPVQPPMAAPPAAPAQQFNPFEFWKAPQDPNEPNMAYGFRHAVGAPFRAVDSAVKDVATGIREGLDTPAAAQARATAAVPATPKISGSFPNSFRDPVYDAADANAARITGVPQSLITSIRLNGERSNNDQVSSKQARSPYQIIPSTRQGIIKKYGIDPLSSPENAALGAAYVLREQAGNPGPHDWTPELAQKAAGGYLGGHAGSENPFLPEISDYVNRVTGAMSNPYDGTAKQYDLGALKTLAAGRSAALQPTHAEAVFGPAPEMPKPEALPTTDFSKAEADLQAMRPMEMTLKEQHQTEWKGFFQGISQAMMHTSGNEGIGTFLLHLGGGALAGKAAAADEIQQEKDKFDTKMAAWQAAVYHGDLAAAQTHAQEAQAQVQQTNEYNMKNWAAKYQQWSQGNNIDISGTNTVIRRTDPATGRVTVDAVPIASAVNAAFAKDAASIMSSMGGREMAGQQQITSMTNAIVGRAAIAAMSDPGASTGTKDAAAAAAPAFYGTFIAKNGGLADVLGSDAAKSLEENVQKQLLQQQLVPGTQQYTDAHDRMIATELAKGGLADPAFMQKMMQVGATAGSFQAMDAMQKSKTTIGTDSHGMPTSRTSAPTYDGTAAGLFDGGSSGYTNEDLAPYGYKRY